MAMLTRVWWRAQLTEKHRRTVKQYEVKVRNVCINLQAENREKPLKLTDYLDEQIKKCEFMLGVVPGVLSDSLMQE